MLVVFALSASVPLQPAKFNRLMISAAEIARKSRTTALSRLNVTTVSSDTTNDPLLGRLSSETFRWPRTIESNPQAFLIAKVTHMAFKTGGRKCKFESLENRQMMAGDVVRRVQAGTLVLKGDNYSNAITITAG